jgi:hypothetical protein
VTRLTVPVITDDMSTLEAAYAYANARLYIGPCERGTKSPEAPLGKGWQHQTSRDIQVITTWFSGTDHGLFIHAGRSDLWIADVDNPANIHPKLQQAITELEPPYQATRTDQPGRGHYLFQQPPGRNLGNSLGRLANGWGEGRGRNGVIIVAPSEHEKPQEGGCYQWVRTGPVPVLPDYVAELLPDAMESEEAATDAQVNAFLAEHRQDQRPELLDIHIAGFQKKITAGESRHGTVLGPMAGAMREAKAGLIDAQFAADAFRSVFEPAVMQKPTGPKQGGARSAAAARSEWNGILAWAVAQGIASDPDETRARVAREVPPPFTEVPAPPAASTNGSAPQSEEFWDARESLRHIRNFARARWVGPWALLGCVLVRVVAATTSKIVLPALAGGQVSLNLYTGIVAFTGGGKGTAESASHEVINLPHVDVVGPGSGEGIGHLFKAWDNKEKQLITIRSSVIISAAEVSTLNAMKARQASTLFPELNKAWMGEPLGFAYVTKEKSLHIKRHDYRLCLITGVQPANADVILGDVDSGSPARYLWMPASDPGASRVRPDEPPMLRGWSLAESVNSSDILNPARLRPMEVCQTAIDAVDQAALDRLHEKPTDLFNSHALLSRLKTAAALALLEKRAGAITEEDWQLAGVVHEVSDSTRQRMIDTLKARQRTANAARALEEGHREVIKGSVVKDDEVKQVCQAVVRKLQREGDWVTGKAARDAAPAKLRHHFPEALDKLSEVGQVEIEEVGGSRKGIQLRFSGGVR